MNKNFDCCNEKLHKYSILTASSSESSAIGHSRSKVINIQQGMRIGYIDTTTRQRKLEKIAQKFINSHKVFSKFS